MKKRVLRFTLVLLAIVLLLFLVRVSFYGGLTGFSVLNENIKEERFVGQGEEILVEFSEYIVVNGELRVEYIVENFNEIDLSISTEGFLYDLDGDLARKKTQEVIVPGNQEGKYVISMNLPKDAKGNFDFFLIVESQEDEIILAKRIFLPRDVLTGLVIAEENRSTLSMYGSLALIFLVLFYAMKLIFRNNALKRTASNIDRQGYIKLDLGKN